MLKIFVYGTLKPGESNYQRFCAPKVLQQQTAIAQGHLYALPIGYPAMTPGDRSVQGFLLTFTDNEILHDLDRLEDYHPHRPPEQNEYNRQLIETFNLSGQPLATAWTYFMTIDRVHHQRGIFIPSGWWSGCRLYTSPYCKF